MKTTVYDGDDDGLKANVVCSASSLQSVIQYGNPCKESW